jgi:hypothetical protein
VVRLAASTGRLAVGSTAARWPTVVAGSTVAAAGSTAAAEGSTAAAEGSTAAADTGKADSGASRFCDGRCKKIGWQQTLPAFSFSPDCPAEAGCELALAGRGSINLYRGPRFLLECAVAETGCSSKIAA